jgi:hypothetical protein
VAFQVGTRPSRLSGSSAGLFGKPVCTTSWTFLVRGGVVVGTLASAARSGVVGVRRELPLVVCSGMVLDLRTVGALLIDTLVVVSSDAWGA